MLLAAVGLAQGLNDVLRSWLTNKQRVDDKTNELQAALELLKTIVLEHRVITGDAMFCQREVCQQVLPPDAHHLAR